MFFILTSHSTQVQEFPVLIIGAGPVGLFSVFTCGMLQLKCAVVDTLSYVGGQCQALYPEKPIYDIPAYPEIRADALIEQLRQQIMPFNPYFHLDDGACNFTYNADAPFPFCLTTQKGQVLYAQSIIIAAGAGQFQPKKPPLDHLHFYEEKSVFYHVQDVQRFKNRRIIIAGGGDSALDWALVLAEIADSVHLIHRRTRFRAAPETQNRLQSFVEQKKIHVHAPYQLSQLHGNITSGELNGVALQSIENASETTIKLLECDNLFLFFGLNAHLGELENWPIEQNKHGILTNFMTGQTSHPRIYAVGDAATYTHKRRLILTGFAESAQAAQHIYQTLFPDAPVQKGFSTSTGVPRL